MLKCWKKIARSDKNWYNMDKDREVLEEEWLSRWYEPEILDGGLKNKSVILTKESRKKKKHAKACKNGKMINVRLTWGYTLKPMVSHFDRGAGPLVESPERHPRFPEPPPRVKRLVMCRLPWNPPKMFVSVVSFVSFVSCSLSADLLDPIFLGFHVRM